MKPGDLVRRMRRGWLALILSIDENNSSAEFVWLDNGETDECSMTLLEVVSESR